MAYTYSPVINGVLTFGVYYDVFPSCYVCGKKYPDVRIVELYPNGYVCNGDLKRAFEENGNCRGCIACSCGANRSHICPITRMPG